ALVLGGFPGDEATPALASIGRRDAGDPWVRIAVLSSATASPAALFERLWHDREFAAGVSLLRPLALMVGARGRGAEAGRVLAARAAGGPEGSSLDVALGLGDGLARGRKRLSDLRAGVPAAVAAWLERLFDRAASTAADASAAPATRARSIALLGQ